MNKEQVLNEIRFILKGKGPLTKFGPWGPRLEAEYAKRTGKKYVVVSHCGGIYVTNDKTQADEMRSLINCGANPKDFKFTAIGSNYRMSEIGALVRLYQISGHSSGVEQSV